MCRSTGLTSRIITATDPMNFLKRAIAEVFGAAFFLSVVLSLLAAGLAVFHPKTPLLPEWNPIEPLKISHPVTPLTGWKLRRAAADGGIRRSILTDAGASFVTMDDFAASANCHIRDRLTLNRIGSATLAPVETRCAIGVRLAMWERHGLQPAAQRFLGTRVQGIKHLSSYNCRVIRTANSDNTDLSTHATAEAIDITGFQFANGKTLQIDQSWGGDGSSAQFLRAARDSACTWFITVLGPDYNALHNDHFHLQSVGWGLCR